jgi:hypothetical protein
MAVTVRIFKPSLDALINDPNGPVVSHQARIGRQVAALAKIKAPKDTGRLRDSISSRITRVGNTTTVKVVADAPHAVFVYRGNRAHWPPIGAMQGWALRHGMSAYQAAFGVARKARPPNRFLLDAARQQGLDAREVK